MLPRFKPSLFSLMLLASAGIASAQDFPSKPLRIATGSAGSGSDIQSRLVAGKLTASLGQPVIVDNRAGLLAADMVSKAEPDGYTLIVNGGFWRHKLVRKVPYDGVTDFSPITIVSRDVNVIAVHPAVPAKSIKELIALAKARPGQLNFATGSPGSTGHLASEQFRSMAGLNMAWIPHKGSAAAVNALVSGQVQMLLLDAGLLMPHHKAGKLRVLAVTSLDASTMAPDMPTVAATGLPGFESVGLTGLFAPAKTPAAVINKLNQEAVRYLRTPEARDAFFGIGTEVAYNTPEQFAAMIKSDLAAATQMVKELGLKPE